VLTFHEGKGAWFIRYLALDIYYLKGDEDNGS